MSAFHLEGVTSEDVPGRVRGPVRVAVEFAKEDLGVTFALVWFRPLSACWYEALRGQDEFEAAIARLMGEHHEPRFAVARLPHAVWGMYNPATNCVLLEACGASERVVKTLLHEARHAYQYAVLHPGKTTAEVRAAMDLEADADAYAEDAYARMVAARKGGGWGEAA